MLYMNQNKQHAWTSFQSASDTTIHSIDKFQNTCEAHKKKTFLIDLYGNWTKVSGQICVKIYGLHQSSYT